MDKTSIIQNVVVEPTLVGSTPRKSPEVVKMVPPEPEPETTTQPTQGEQWTNEVEHMQEDPRAADEEMATELVMQGLLEAESARVSEEVLQLEILEKHESCQHILEWLGKQVTVVVARIEAKQRKW